MDEYSQDIEAHKRRVSQMLDYNSQFWKRVKENTRATKTLFEIDHSINYNKIIPSSPGIIENSIYTHLQDQKADNPINPKIKRKRGNLPKATTALLKEWLSQHKKHPYPTEDEKMALARGTQLSLQQISNCEVDMYPCGSTG
ncbi:6790_t:CDS:2, partial [Entrophospora sp. SA101]